MIKPRDYTDCEKGLHQSQVLFFLS